MDFRIPTALVAVLLSLNPSTATAHSVKQQGGTNATAIQFDTVAARAAGYTASEIAVFLDSVGAEKILAARAAGYTDAEILAYADSVRSAPTKESLTAREIAPFLWSIPLALLALLIWAAIRGARFA